MKEEQTVTQSARPQTRQSIRTALRALGLRRGHIVLTHTSLSSLGWVCGGEVAVIQALLDVLGPEGTLMVPTHSSSNTEPSNWCNPPVPEDWWPIIRDTMPAFDPHLTPTRGMGRIPEVLRTWPGAHRSAHPTTSFAAIGLRAETLTQNHALEFGMGDNSPLARLYELDGQVLLLGVGHDRNTSLHLAEARTPGTMIQLDGSALYEHEQRVWKTYPTYNEESELFPQIGQDFEATHPCTVGKVGMATARLMHQRPLVDFGITWLSTHRSSST